jgi:TLD
MPKQPFSSTLDIMQSPVEYEDVKNPIGSSNRQATLVRRQRNNATHSAMLHTMSIQRGRQNENRTAAAILNAQLARQHALNHMIYLDHAMRKDLNDDESGADEDEHSLEEASSSTPSIVQGPLHSKRTLSEGSKYDPWERVDEDFSGIHFDFSIIGTSAHDESALPHVLSPPLMHRLQDALPYCKRGESFWLKYSLVRDGASLSIFLDKMRDSKHTVMAIETVDGEVFGAFTGEPWHIDRRFYGSTESFVWRMRHHRGEISESMAEQAQRESDIDIFRYTFANQMIQLCQDRPHRLAIGGGSYDFARELGSGEVIQPHQWGFAIIFDGESLLEGVSSPSISFESPSLSERHRDGSKFEVLNLEMWALTPCLSVEEAQIMEFRKSLLVHGT